MLARFFKIFKGILRSNQSKGKFYSLLELNFRLTGLLKVFFYNDFNFVTLKIDKHIVGDVGNY